MTLDMTPRYTPDSVIVLDATGPRNLPVLSRHAYPPRMHPKGCPINPDMTAVELRTDVGSRWYGCASAHINSELRLIVIGTPDRDEVRMRWTPCTTR